MTVISTNKAQAIEWVRQAQQDLTGKLRTLGDGKEFFADLIVVTDANDFPLFISRMQDGVFEKHEIVVPTSLGQEESVGEAVKLLLKDAS